jgi:hypothetical protein
VQEAVTLEEVLNRAKQLALSDKVRLIGQVAREIERELVAAEGARRNSLRGPSADLESASSAEEG